jgi:hypothetical protein
VLRSRSIFVQLGFEFDQKFRLGLRNTVQWTIFLNEGHFFNRTGTATFILNDIVRARTGTDIRVSIRYMICGP